MKNYLIAFFSFWMFLEASAQKNNFIWGVASASYQVEGAYKADGKGVSNWDVYTNKYHITKYFTSSNQTGNIAVNQYNRAQYLKDFALMKKLGVTHYRFSIAWSRILPNGIGAVNEKGIQHYKKFIADLLSFGIQPCVTIYHWDMPEALQEKGGWNNPQSIDWYIEYSNTVFRNFGKQVKYFITFNEPNIELYLFAPTVKNIIAKKTKPFSTTSQEFADQAIATNNLLIANAIAINNYHKMKLGGEIGITLNLWPTIAKDSNNKKDITTAIMEDGIHNRWFLDASLKGTYPEDILKLYNSYNVNIPPFENTVVTLKNYRPDFIGVNYYAPQYVSYDEHFAMNDNWETNNPDSITSYNGPVRPDYLYKLLMRIKNEYNDPEIIITENGAGFGDRDEKIIDGKINDSLRCDYIRRHIDAALQAKKDGVRLSGYFLWSIFDNFEWVWGYDKRLGIVHVNFATQQRIPKRSYFLYKKIIAENKNIRN